MTFDRDDSAGYLVNHIARLFAKELHRRIQPLGIVPGQFPMLLALWEKDGVTQRDLLDQIDIEQATLANTLTRMERDGLIRRTPHPSDARAQLIWLTEKAKTIKSDAYRAAEETNAEALADLSDPERRQLLELIRRVIATIRDKSSG